MEVNLTLKKSQFSPTLYPLLLDYSHRTEIYKGSAGSGKSYFITQKILVRAIREPIKVMVCRRYGSTLRNSCFSLFKEILAKWKLTKLVKIRETDMTIQFPHNGSEIIFVGLDNEEKLLSINNISCIFVEEIYEISKDIFEQLNLRMRGQANNQQILAAFNPISQHHWLYDYCVVNPPENFLFSETTYKDNPFLNQDYIDFLEEMIIRNPDKARVFVFGQWGVPSDQLILRNWVPEDFDVSSLIASGLERRAGCDLGFVDPTVIIDTLYDRKNGIIYVFNEFMAYGQQLDMIAEAMTEMELKRQRIYMDSSEPRSIDFFRKKGYNVQPCIKGRDSVRAGVSFLQNHKIVVHPKCHNFIKAIENYSYIKDKKTGQLTEEIDHSHSHFPDSLRYAYSDIYTKSGLKTMDKAVLGL